MSIYYVDTGGDDGTGDGSFGNPWLTIGYALSQSNSGDTVRCNDGTYNEGQLIVPVGVNLTSTSQDKTGVIIQPNTNLGLWPFINLSSASPGSNGNQTISYLSFSGETGTYSGLVGIKVENRSNTKITYCNISNFAGSNGARGVHARSTEIPQNANWDAYWPADPQLPGIETNIDALWPANPVENFELSYCNVINCGHRDTLGSGSKYSAVEPFHLKNSSIHHNVINTEDSRGEPIKATPAFLDNVDIYNNDITAAHYTSQAIWTIELWIFRRGCEIYNNTVNGSLSITFGKETKVHDNTIILTWPDQYDRGAGIEFIGQCEGEAYRNYIERAGDPGIDLGMGRYSGHKNRVARNIKIYNNIIYNPWASCVQVQNRNQGSGDYTVENIEVYNNTCDDLARTHTYSGLLVIVSENTGSGTVTTQNVEIKNNILVNGPGYAGKTVGTVTNLVIDHNLFYGNNVNDWSGGTDTNTVIADPVFIGTGDRPDYYKIQTSSNAKDAGTNSVSGVVIDDYWGTARPVNSIYDIGAHEYGLVLDPSCDYLMIMGM